MSNDCGCGGKKTAAANAASDSPAYDPPPLQQTSEGSTMSDQSPSLLPPQVTNSGGGGGDATASTGAPTLTPETANASDGGITAWNNSKRVSALWAMNQNRNSWVYVTGVGWKKLANNSDSAVVALTILSAHAKQTQTNYNYRDEADGMIHETYVW